MLFIFDSVMLKLSKYTFKVIILKPLERLHHIAEEKAEMVSEALMASINYSEKVSIYLIMLCVL